MQGPARVMVPNRTFYEPNNVLPTLALDSSPKAPDKMVELRPFDANIRFLFAVASALIAGSSLVGAGSGAGGGGGGVGIFGIDGASGPPHMIKISITLQPGARP